MSAAMQLPDPYHACWWWSSQQMQASRAVRAIQRSAVVITAAHVPFVLAAGQPHQGGGCTAISIRESLWLTEENGTSSPALLRLLQGSKGR